MNQLLAQKFTNPVVGDTLINLESAKSDQFLVMFIPRFIGLLFVIGSLAFFFMFIWGAISWILSGGDKAGLESAKNRINHALVGLVLLIATFALVKVIESFFGINILAIDIGTLIIQ